VDLRRCGRGTLRTGRTGPSRGRSSRTPHVSRGARRRRPVSAECPGSFGTPIRTTGRRSTRRSASRPSTTRRLVARNSQSQFRVAQKACRRGDSYPDPTRSRLRPVRYRCMTAMVRSPAVGTTLEWTNHTTTALLRCTMRPLRRGVRCDPSRGVGDCGLLAAPMTARPSEFTRRTRGGESAETAVPDQHGQPATPAAISWWVAWACSACSSSWAPGWTSNTTFFTVPVNA
jgi:hypothetical protein